MSEHRERISGNGPSDGGAGNAHRCPMTSIPRSGTRDGFVHR